MSDSSAFRRRRTDSRRGLGTSSPADSRGGSDTGSFGGSYDNPQRGEDMPPRQRMSSNSQRQVLITGAASGLGLAMAKIYLEQGCKVWITDLNVTTPPDISALSGDWEYLQLDVTNDEHWNAAVKTVGNLDVLVSNAGIAVGGQIEKISMDTWQRALDINVLGAVRAVRAFSPLMNDGARIAITSSLAGLVHAPLMSTYNTTKAACVALAETLDAEFHHRNISVSAICPQFFRSGLAGSLTGDDEKADDFARKLLGGTYLTSETVAHRSVQLLEKRRRVIVPDAFSIANWYIKRFIRPLHLTGVRFIGNIIARRR
ncbi:SDR family NAD(P)-dependent oxidoreductase [Corynebacterium anserum]|uniref:SDR family NAD(P)-dependent oxidoreductase n=1 Tax=Corynebacterium anserum TaxID=2684406 RepID=UPI0021AEB601|nr:SDR family NAD(P)-dependent oxidoreductase [Corynebacterium anserum]